MYRLIYKIKKFILKAIYLSLLIVLAMLPCPAMASDVTEAAMLLVLQAIAGYDAFIQTYTDATSGTEKDELTEIKSEWAELSKNYGMSESEIERENRLWSADDWNNVLIAPSSGNPAKFNSLKKYYSTNYPLLSDSAPLKLTQLSKNTYQNQNKTYNAALVTSAYSYDDINNRINKLDSILKEVDDTDKNPNVKAATDLNSRLVAEVGFIELEMLKMQSISTQMQATHNASDLNGDTIDQQFFKWK